MTPSVDNPMERLNRDLIRSARLMDRKRARYIVDFYYQVQEFRKATANQVLASGDGEGSALLDWANESMRRFENDLKRALDAFTNEFAVSRWAKSIVGIGPVLSAGFVAHLDIRKAKTVGHFWRFAGLDPTMKWEKGQKRPWNAFLKTLCFKTGDCFIKFCNHEDGFYGKIYIERKAWEAERNARGMYAERAKLDLETKKIGKDTKKYAANIEGRLHDGHINDRARRYAVKMFLSHLHHVMYWDYYGEAPPVPYAMEHVEGDHRHYIPPPNFPWDGGGKSLREMFADD